MTPWPGPNSGRPEPIDPHTPHEQHNPPPGPQGGYQQPWGTPTPTPHQVPAAPDAYQQPWGAQPPGPGAAVDYEQPWAAQPPGPGTAANYQQPWNQPAPQGSSAQPWAQPPGSGGAAPGWQTGPSELGLGGPTPPKSRKGLLVTVAVVALVAALAFVGYRVTTGDGIAGIGARSALSPSQTVQQYLDALAAGDAEKALSFGSSQPANTDLLTNEILAKQNAEMPITNIRILGEDNTGDLIGSSTVHVAVNFGDVADDTQVRLKKGADGAWKLEDAAVKLESPPGSKNIEAYGTATIFGKPLNKGALYVFPGYMDVGSTNEYLELTAEPVLLSGLAAYGSTYLRPDVALNDAGSDALKQQIADDFANCGATTLLDPPGCPVKVSGYDARDAVDGTATWGQTDLSGATFGTLSPYNLTVAIRGEATTPVTFLTAEGQTKSGTVTTYLSGEADITTTPPTIKTRH